MKMAWRAVHERGYGKVDNEWNAKYCENPNQTPTKECSQFIRLIMGGILRRADRVGRNINQPIANQTNHLILLTEKLFFQI